MIVNAAIFTCSICGESSSNICAYCTKDACSNHRCERCKRCSDCCECEVPLSAEEPAVMEAVIEPVPELEIETPQPEPQLPAPPAALSSSVFLTAAESSVFVAGSVFTEPSEQDELIDPPNHIEAANHTEALNQSDSSHHPEPVEPYDSDSPEPIE
jgi:hypothetical protein